MNGSIYFLSDGELIKVGYAKSVGARIIDLQTGNGRRIEEICSAPATLKQERRLHALLPQRAEGEWFRPSPKLLRLIAMIVSTPKQARSSCVPNFIRHEIDKIDRRREVERQRSHRLIARLRAETRELIAEIIAERGCAGLGRAIGFSEGAVRFWASGKSMPSALAIVRIGTFYPERIMDLHRPLGRPPLIARAERLGIAA